MTTAHRAIRDAVDYGLLEPIRALDGDGRDVTVYVPTSIGARYFGPQFSQRQPRNNVVPLRTGENACGNERT